MYDDPPALAALVAGVGWAIAVAVVDVRRRRVPVALVVAGLIPVGIAAWATGRPVPALAGGLGLFALYLLMAVIRPGAVGAGDVKLAAPVGALSGIPGWEAWALAGIVAFVLSALIGLVLALARRPVTHEGRSVVPHGPSMVIAALAVLTPTLL